MNDRLRAIRRNFSLLGLIIVTIFLSGCFMSNPIGSAVTSAMLTGDGGKPQMDLDNELDFYCSGEEWKNGIRIISNVSEPCHPKVSRLTLTSETWYDLFFADDASRSNEMNAFFWKYDGNSLRFSCNCSSLKIREVHDETFTSKAFFELNSQLQREATSISIYRENLISIFSAETNRELLFIIPGLTLESFKEEILSKVTRIQKHVSDTSE